MPTEAGFTNTKKQGRQTHKTLHPLGSSRVGQHVVNKSLVERQAIPVAITGVQENTDNKLIRITLAGHTALVGDIARFYTGALQGAELEIVGVPDANNFIIRNVVGLPTVADTIKVMYYVTSKSDAEGNVNFSPGPTTFSQDGAVVTVAEDTANPANNKGLPVNMVFYKDGVPVTVNVDSVTPANNRLFPVELSSLAGPINVTAGDLNVSIDSTNDSTAIGDAVTGNKAIVRLNDDAVSFHLKTKDDDANAKLAAIETATGLGATEITLATRASEPTLDLVRMAAESIAAEDFSTLAAQTAQTALLTTIDADTSTLASSVNTDGNPAGTTGVLVGGKDPAGDFQHLNTTVAGELLVSFGAAGFATETTLSALNTKVANDYGASLGAVRTAAQLGNATGQADFGVGADSAQTLRTSSNLKRAGNELSYNSGAADANTLRNVLATRHEDSATPLSMRLGDSTAFYSTAVAGSSSQAISTDQRGINAVTFPVAWNGVQHVSLLATTAGVLRSETQEKLRSYSDANPVTISDVAVTSLATPGNVVKVRVLALETNSVNLRVRIDNDPSATSGFQLQPGREVTWETNATTVRLIAEAVATGQGAYVNFEFY